MLCNSSTVKMFYYYFFCVFVFISISNCEIINTKVIKSINLKSQLVKMRVFVTFKNVDANCTTNFVYLLEPHLKVAFISFKDDQKKDLGYEAIKFNQNEVDGYKVHLKKCLTNSESVTVIVESVYIEQIIPLHKTRDFSENQFLLYTGNLFFYSPYETLSSTTKLILPNVENAHLSHTSSYQDDRSVRYFNSNFAPFTVENLKIEFMSNIKLLVVTKLRRFIDVSHYGQICVEDQVDIKNAGSKLVGSFQYDLRNENLDWFFTHIPASADNIKFYDIIGNNSKSQVLNMNQYKTFKFKTRYPLLSGWKTFYILKYCVPTYEYLYHDQNGHFSFRMRAIDHIVDDVIVKDAVIQVLLPEFSEVIDVELPHSYNGFQIVKSYTALIQYGRPTVVFNASNLLENHIENFDIKYKLSPYYLLHTPAILMVYIQTMFVIFIVIVHY